MKASTISVVGDLLGIDGVQSVDGWSLGLAAPWAARMPWLVPAGCAVAAMAAIWFYARWQPALGRGSRWLLTCLRAALGALLVLLLADPVLQLSLRQLPRPLLWVLFDGSESMELADELPADERAALDAATGRTPSSSVAPTRADDVAAWLRRGDGNVLGTLAERFRLKGYSTDTGSSVRPLDLPSDGAVAADVAALADQLTTTGQVTALGRALEDLAARHGAASLQGVLVISDFDQNAGPPAAEAARRLGVPVYTLGVGPALGVDVAVAIQAPPIMKKSERSTVVATLRHVGLDAAQAEVTVTARPLDVAAGAGEEPVRVGRQTVTLAAGTVAVEFPFVPDQVGRYEFAVDVAPLDGETVDGNNRAVREVSVRDDFLRLMYVEYEPTWEWRFVKEVFHRDPLVGRRGFRTFLRSADPQVRATNELFLPTPAPKRGDFFTNDVIFLGDMPSAALPARFCEMTREFVETFGGGLVVIAGNRFGPGELADTPLADMLPVVFAGGERPRTKEPFTPRLTAAAGFTDFMQLGGDEAEHAAAWENLGTLPWYQPVARPHPQATVLMEHPHDTCADGRTPQPLVAIRRYGRGEVVYVGCNETWRLRKRYGERYYRQFWGQMIHRLGLSHSLGSQKRFVVRLDASSYQVDDTALVTVEAYDANFDPLGADAITAGRLTGRLLRPAATSAADAEPVALTELRKGVFEARIPIVEPGDHALEVEDPITAERTRVAFSVSGLSVERRSATRNVRVQEAIAAATGGAAYDLTTADRLLDDLVPAERVEHAVRVVPLGMTWLALAAGLGLMIAEWLVRKRCSLA